MVEKYGFAHLSAGDLLREEVSLLWPKFNIAAISSYLFQRDSGSETAALINQCIVEGKIVPVEITCQLLKRGMEKQGWGAKRFLIDGFPRNQDNFDGWERVVGEYVDMPFVLFMEADEETMISRIMERSKTSGRNDDNIEALRKRFATFRNESMPIITKYEGMGKVRRIDGLQPIDEVFAEVERTFKDYI